MIRDVTDRKLQEQADEAAHKSMVHGFGIAGTGTLADFLQDELPGTRGSTGAGAAAFVAAGAAASAGPDLRTAGRTLLSRTKGSRGRV